MLKSKKRFCLPLVHGLTILLFSLVLISTVSAENTNYFYDELGRIIKAVAETGDAATYNYDEIGNLLSIDRQTTKPLPPVLNSVTPDIAFAGANMTIAISGTNLFTTESVWSGNGIIINSFTSSDTVITANITLPSDMPLGTTTVNVKTLYGSASINLDVYKLTLEPATKYLSSGETVNISVSLTPVAPKDLTIAITNKNPDIISCPQSVIVPANGNAAFTIQALKQGTGILVLSGATATIFVTPSFSGPASINSTPVSAAFNSVPSGAPIFSTPVSAAFDIVPSGAAIRSEPISVAFDMVNPGAPIISLPVGVSTEQVIKDSRSGEVSVQFEVPNTAINSGQVSTKINNQ